jgi:hypothetical protein
MQLDLDMGDLERTISEKSPEEVRKLIKKSMEGMATEWESEAKRIIQDGALDTGEFANSIHFEMFEEGDEIGFIGSDGVDYGIHWEYGTIKHWVPFYRHNNLNEPVLAEWGKRVLGMTEEEMLKMGGMMVQIPELSPFMRAMIKAQSEAPDIFKGTFMEV